MSLKLIGREREKSLMDDLIASDSPEFLVVYGRRRVGKTFLIRQHFQKNLVFDFTGAYRVNFHKQLENFFSRYLEITKGALETTLPTSWSQAFQYLARFISIHKERKSKIILFIDEMPWLDTPKSGFISALEYFWNQHGSQQGNLLLVVCGSATSWIHKKLLRAKGGLHNRVTQRIHLKPFTLRETERFCKTKYLQLTRYQLVQLYMVMGGIPYYLQKLKPGRSAVQLIDDLCFNPEGTLVDEYDQLYYSLFRNAKDHLSIVEALATKPNGLIRNELVKYSKISDGGSITRALNELIESGFVARYKPFQKKRKDTIYKLVDFYSLFYLKFIKNQTLEGSGTWEKRAMSSSYIAWSGYAYENICMAHLAQIKKALGISGIYTEFSSWWYQGGDEMPRAQIDLIIDRSDQVINLCEAKFTKENFIITKQYLDKLRQRRSIFQYVTKTKKAIFTTLITTYPAMKNQNYLEEIHSEVTMDDLFG